MTASAERTADEDLLRPGIPVVPRACRCWRARDGLALRFRPAEQSAGSNESEPEDVDDDDPSRAWMRSTRWIR